eukprot:CAMPEP_0181180062 /NCGR_PEP_ID=MMETSP1096-20121128/6596_1 /TAXON_ID=156174 ORGANISM="Chrysochromulina ericina, Strain CCMP281" /NCGR_SAMPLE_ID=MMETSP1096 /ASSEMBLY_ACC=CAM_ASM_000453 /LENGTH=52 /DNA_ID=CAMNT_0023268459 /DNA_START=126 /DNA_END=287 /DNA_ORIENTATION=+
MALASSIASSVESAADPRADDALLTALQLRLKPSDGGSYVRGLVDQVLLGDG